MAACRRGRARAARQCRARERSGSGTMQSSTVWPDFSRVFAKKVIQSLYTKVVDPVLLYNFQKGCRIFFSTIFAKFACQDAEILGSSE
jgi:hypothetical protein